MNKIAFIIELLGTKRHGGEQVAMKNVAENLQKIGTPVDIFSYLAENKDFKIKSSIPLRLLLLPFIRDMFFVPVIGRNLFRKIEHKYDTINASSTTIASLYKPKCKFVITAHIIRSQKFETLAKIPKYKLLFNPLVYWFMFFLEKRSFKNADQIIVIKPHQKEFLIKKFNIKQQNICVVPNGINTDLFKPQKVEKKYSVIFVGRGTIPKGLDTLLDASDKIKGKILLVVSKIDDSLLNLAQQKKNVIIKFKATQKELVTLYSESQIFVLPSLDDERQTLTAMEAMSCGLPVVVTDKAGGDIVEQGINGYIIPEKSSLAIVNRIELLFKNQKRLNSMYNNNRNKIVNNNSLNKVTTRFKEILIYKM